MVTVFTIWGYVLGTERRGWSFQHSFFKYHSHHSQAGFRQGKGHGHNLKGVHFVCLTEVISRPWHCTTRGCLPIYEPSRTLLQDKGPEKRQQGDSQADSAEVTAPKLQLGQAGPGPQFSVPGRTVPAPPPPPWGSNPRQWRQHHLSPAELKGSPAGGRKRHITLSGP